MPAGDGIIFKYGTYEFDPRPLFNYTKEVIKTPANTGLSEKYTVTLNGHILPIDLDLDNNKGGLTTVMGDVATLRTAFSRDFDLLLLQCDSEAPLISGYPKVANIDVNVASDNYVRRADYTISLELVSLNGIRSTNVGIRDCEGGYEGDLSTQGLISISEDFSIEFSDERVGSEVNIDLFDEDFPSVFTIQRSLSAQGDSLACIDAEGKYIEPWVRASGYIYDNIGIQPAMSSLVGLMCTDGLNLANNFRTISVNRPEGSVSSSESWVAYHGNHTAIEEVEVSVDRSLDSPFTNISVNGTLVGLASNINYDVCPTTGEPKFNGAYAKWLIIKGTPSYNRANKVFGTVSAHAPLAKGTLNTIPLTETVGYNPIAGTISYSYSYDNRPTMFCLTALSESITYTQNDPTDLFASLTILGRGEAFLQNLNTKEPLTEEISIDAILQPATAGSATPPTCSVYDTLMKVGQSTDAAGYVTNDSKSWEPTQGHFTWTKSWTKGSCL